MSMQRCFKLKQTLFKNGVHGEQYVLLKDLRKMLDLKAPLRILTFSAAAIKGNGVTLWHCGSTDVDLVQNFHSPH